MKTEFEICMEGGKLQGPLFFMKYNNIKGIK